jgi:hypothetical protein
MKQTSEMEKQCKLQLARDEGGNHAQLGRDAANSLMEKTQDFVR